MKRILFCAILIILVLSFLSSSVSYVKTYASPSPQVTASLSYVEAQTGSIFSVDFELRNIGDPSSSDSFLTVSVSNGLEIDSCSTTPFLSDMLVTHYHPGDLIWHSDGTQIMAYYELVDVHDHPYAAGELVTITITFRAPDWTSGHWIKYRAAMLPEGVTYPTEVPTERDPSEGTEEDQQGYPVYTIGVNVVALHEGEWFAQVTQEPFDSDGDGSHDAVRIGMNADTVDGTMTVHVYNSMYRNFGAHGFVDDDSQEWDISGTDVEWEYSFLYVSLSHPYGNYEVILHLYDESNNLEDEYIFYVDLYPGEANPRKWIQDVEVNYLVYDETGPLPEGWPNVVELRINVDTEGGEEKVEVYGNLTDDDGNVLDYSGTGGWTIHGTDVEWEEMYLWLDPPNPPGYYWVYLELLDWDTEMLEDTERIRVGQLYPTGYTPPEFELTISTEIVSPPVLGETTSLNVTLENTGTSPISAGDYTVTVTFWDYYERGGIDSFRLWANGSLGEPTIPIQLGPTPTPITDFVSVLNPGDTYTLGNIEVPVLDYQSPSLILTDTILVEVDGPDSVSGSYEIQGILVELGMKTYFDAVAAAIETQLEGFGLVADIAWGAVENAQEEHNRMVESFNAGDLVSSAKYCALMGIQMAMWIVDMSFEEKLDILTNLIMPWRGGFAIANMLIWWYNFKAVCHENDFDLSSLSPSQMLGIAVGLILWTDPVNLTIVDPMNRVVGVLGNPGTVNESPNAYIIEVNGNIEAIFFPELIEGTYKVNCTGVEQGEFSLRVEATNQSTILCNETSTGFIGVGEILGSEVIVTQVDDSFEVAVNTLPRMGDVNSDGIVDSLDLEVLAEAYGSISTSPNWNPNADVNKDGIIDIVDIKIAGTNWGKTWGRLVELYYDDGVAEGEYATSILPHYKAVRFHTPASGTYKLEYAKYYITSDPASFELQIRNSTAQIIYSEVATPTDVGWFAVDLSSQDIYVEGDFYIVMKYLTVQQPKLGADYSDPDMESYEGTGFTPPPNLSSLDWMIRAGLEP